MGCEPEFFAVQHCALRFCVAEFCRRQYGLEMLRLQTGFRSVFSNVGYVQRFTFYRSQGNGYAQDGSTSAFLASIDLEQKAKSQITFMASFK
jgi:hypothetical protein